MLCADLVRDMSEITATRTMLHVRASFTGPGQFLAAPCCHNRLTVTGLVFALNAFIDAITYRQGC